MAWSIFSNGGGNGAALTWAQNLLTQMGAPVTPGNEQFVYDWELSEGGGGNYNPLNQGPVPGQPQLTSSGEQYGGGAANYVSYAAGIQGAIDYLNMPNYTAVKAAIMADNPSAAESALFNSPWAASHYGYGSSFSNQPIPGQATSLINIDGSTGNASGNTSNANAQNANWVTNLFSYNGQISDLKSLFGAITGSASGSLTSGLQGLVIRGSLIVFGAAILIVGLVKMTGHNTTVSAVMQGPYKAAVSGASKAKKSVSGG